MKLLSSLRRPAIVLGAGALALIVASQTFAHVSVNPREAPAGSFARLDFRVGHGCDGSPTTSVRIQIPSGVVSVRPENKPGWDIDVVTGELDEPYENHGELVTEGIVEVSWSGGSLPDHLFEDFGLSVRLPDSPGETLYFPVIQECEEGEHAWIQIPANGEDAHDLDEPAPALLLTAAGGGHGGTDASVDSGEQSSTNPAVSGTTSETSTVAWFALALGVLAVILGGTGLALAVRKR